MGTPEFAIPTLDMLDKQYSVCAVVTQPDKPKGRGKKLTAPPVKEFALARNIPVLQPDKIRTIEFIQELQALEPDLLVTAAYGKILPQAILQTPPLGCINVHGSLLPKYRGAAPIHWAILKGETITGITTMFTDVGVDTGDILLKNEIEISKDITVGELHDQMAKLGALTLQQTLIALENKTLVRIPQQEDEASYAPMIDKEIGAIDFTKSVKEIHDLVRGTNPWPVAYTKYSNHKLKIWKTEVLQEIDFSKDPGTILRLSNEGLDVACGDGILRIIELQPESGRRMQVRDYLCGHTILEGERLG